MKGLLTNAPALVVRRRWRVGAVTAVVLAALATAALAATVDTSATLSTSSTTPSTVNIGANGFDIYVSATGNVPSSSTGDVAVTSVYNMSTNGTITASTVSTDRTTVHFPAHNYVSGTSGVCNGTTQPQGCPNNPFVVSATLNVASGTAGGTNGTLTVAATPSSGLGLGTLATGHVQVYSPTVDNPPSDPGAPTISSGLTPNNNGVFTLSWTPSTVTDGDTITYTLEQANASGNWTTVGPPISGTSYSFGSDGNPAEGEGTWSYRVTANDSGGLPSNPATSPDLVVVDERAPYAPTADITPSGSTYTDPSTSDVWYEDSVTVGFADNGDPNLADGSPGSGVDLSTLTSASTFDSSNVDSTTGAFHYSGTVGDFAGNVSSTTTVNGFVDWLAPVVTASPTTPFVYTDASDNNWWKDTVSFDVSASDPAPSSGMSTDPSGTYGPYTDVGTFSESATDNVGHTSSSTPIAYNVDSSVPLASFSNCPASELLNANVTAGWTASDAAPSSGLATPASGSVTLDTSQPGLQTASSPAPKDNVGNVGDPASCQYIVNYNTGAGFLPPVANDPIVNNGKAGRTYPLKWQLQDANGAYISVLSSVSSVVAEPVTCGSFTGADTSTDTATTTGGTTLRYDTTDNQFVYNWQSPSKTGCYVVYANLASGQVLQADFKLS